MFVVFSLLLTAASLGPAVGKLLGLPKIRHAAAHFGIPWSRYRLLAIPELAAAGGILAGLLWRPVGIAAGIGMALLLLGALAYHRRAHDPHREALPALAALAVSAAYLAVALSS
ncbi:MULTISPECIES: DoxX family protein [unclassified Kribbella]|uniref:DoxX family protein n=1 Tax=unclassified Kribbella TaxID=2644121 RepID=UPI0030786AC4